MSTDDAWRRWGEQDPYFAVITDPKYRASNLTDDARKEFFASGERHARHVLDIARREFGRDFAPKRALDFGCGVGRVALGLAPLVERVVGVDVAPAMLAEARRIAADQAVGNVDFVLSDDTLSRVEGRFGLVHSFIVLQHIDVPRGRQLFGRLVGLVEPGGVGAIHVTYAKAYHAERFGQPPPPPSPPAPAPPGMLAGLFRRGAPESEAPAAPPPGADPEMQMNAYPLNELFFLLQNDGLHELHVRFTDHGGELGAFLFFKRAG